MIAFLMSLTAGCGEGRPEPFRGSVAIRDTAGAEIVYSESPAWTEDGGWSLDSTPAVVLGPEFGPERFFFRTGDIERLEDGRLVVENRGTRELVVFDSTGVFLDAWGGSEEGPQGFGNMQGLFRCEVDRLVEFHSRGLTFLDSAGGVVRTVTLPQQLRGTTKRVSAVSPDCGSIFVWGRVPRYGPTDIGTHVYPVQGYRASLGAPGIDTLGTFPGFETVANESGDRERARFPFAYKPNWASDGRGVYYGWGDRPEIVVVSPDGSVSRLIRWNPPSPRITEADWRAYEADQRVESRVDPRGAGLNLPREEHPRPTMKPYFGPPDNFGSAFRISDEGYLWVRHYARFLAWNDDRPTPTVRWSIFDPEGRWLGELETPENFEVRSIRGDLVLGVWRDEFDVEEVRAYRIWGRER